MTKPLNQDEALTKILNTLCWNFEWADKEYDIAKAKAAITHQLNQARIETAQKCLWLSDKAISEYIAQLKDISKGKKL